MSVFRSLLLSCCFTPLLALNIPRQADNTSTATNLTVDTILSKAIAAVGGQDALSSLKTVSFHALIFRTFSLAESYTPGIPNTAIATVGEQTISYNLSNASQVVQRIDRTYTLGDYWTFYRPQLAGVDSSLVVQSGSDGYACYTKGNQFLFAPYDAPSGYTDPAYADLLVQDAWRLSPGLLISLQAANSTLTASNETVNGVRANPAIHDPSTNLTIIFDPATFLISRVRAYEDHLILGPSTNDFILYNYTETQGIKFARNMKLLYNENIMLQETLYDSVTVNANLSSDYFEGLPPSIVNETLFGIPPTPAHPSEEYGSAEIFEYSSNMFWTGGYLGKLSNMTVVKPIPGLDNLYHLTFNDDAVYKTILTIFDDAIMVTDAPPHQSKLVIQYVQEKFDRNVTHLLVTHHHHDHNLGASDYVDIGAKMVVPADFTYYWQNIPNVQFETVDDGAPFKYKDSKMQVRAVWHKDFNAHSADWMYFTFAEACPTADSPMGVVSADGWSPGFHPWDYGQDPVVEWLAIARADQIPRGNIALPIHGNPTNSTELYEQVGYEYPEYTTTDFLPGGPWC